MSAQIHALYCDHHGWLYGWLRRKLGCPHHAADVAQSTFLRVLGARDALQGIEQPRAWLTTTATRLIVDEHRRQRIEQAYLAELALHGEASEASPEQTLIALQALEQLVAALEAVPPKARTAFVRHHLDGETMGSVAGELGVSTRMVQKYLVQVQDRLGDTEQARAVRDDGAARATLRRLGACLVLALATAVTAVMVRPDGDLHTAAGEHRAELLADGSRLELGTCTAVNVELQDGLRRVELLRGELLVDVAKDPSRPFVVDTAHGRIRALGTRFIVRRDGDATLLTMLESSTAVSAAADEARIDAGQRAQLSAGGIERLDGISPGLLEDAFKHRRLLVQDRPLTDVLDELSRHRRGLLRYERERLQHIRVTAVLPLDDTDRALQLLVNNFPQLRVRTVTPWVVLVD